MPLTHDQEEAIATTEGARALINSLNKEAKTLRKTIVNTQDQLEVWRTRYHNADKKNSILNTKLDVFVGIECVKFLLSAVGTAFGINLITSSPKNNSGFIYVVASVCAYALLTWWQRKE